MVNDGGDCEEVIGLLFRVEAWSTGFEVADHECETEWRGTSPHSKKKSLFVQR